MTVLRQIILDTETTGLSPEHGHRIIEIGCLEMINRRLTDHSYHQYINPEREVEQGAQAVHGISQAFLEDKPVFSEIADAFLAFVDGSELLIHNAPFDVGFINYELALLNSDYSPIDETCGVVDTLTIARRKHPGQQNSLDALCRRYHVDNSNRDLHGALLDAELLAQVYLLMTGGQTQLFQTESAEGASMMNASQKIRRLPKNRAALPVISASAEETQAHEAFIEKLLCVDS